MNFSDSLFLIGEKLFWYCKKIELVILKDCMKQIENFQMRTKF